MGDLVLWHSEYVVCNTRTSFSSGRQLDGLRSILV